MPCRSHRVLTAHITTSLAHHPPSFILPFLYQTSTIQQRCFRASRSTQDPAIDQQAPVSAVRKVSLSEPRRGIRRSHPRDRPTRQRDWEPYDTIKLHPPQGGNTRPDKTSEPALISADKRQDGFPQFSTGTGDALGANEHSRARARSGSSTMTDVERKAFERLFDSLSKDIGSKAKDPSDANQANTDSGRRPAEEDLYDRFQEEDLDDIDLDIDVSSTSVRDLPEELQGMASRAHIEMEREKQRQRARQALEEKGKEYDPVVAAQRKEFRRIESGLYKAGTDVEIWQLLDSDVFPKLMVLEKKRQEAQAAEEKVERERKRQLRERVGGKENKTKNNAPTKEQAKSTEDDQPKNPLPANAYQFIFLLAVRLLCRRTAYTPLATSLLPAIKSHSLTSSILGTSTPLYNEILAYRWRVFYDIGSMVSLILEMESSGLPMDRRTLAVLDDVSLYRYRALRGDFGLALQAVEKMVGREAEALELNRRKKDLRNMLDEQALERSRRIELERSIVDDGGDEDADGGVVAAAGAS